MKNDNNSFKVPNFLKINDWEIKKFLFLIYFIQIAVLALIFLETNGLNIPIIRELISVVYLLFIPGFLLLRIFKLHNLDSIENILYSVGLSIASLMFIGFLMNFIYPMLHIKNPISLLYLVVTLTAVIIFLSILSYLIDKDFQDEAFIIIQYRQRPMILFLCLIPFLAIIGTYYVNLYENNIFLMVTITLIALMPILVAFNKISKQLYPFMIFIISISLLFHTSLISNFLWGWDIFIEYNLAHNVLILGQWNPNFSSNLNAMLSIVMLSPLISTFSDLDLIWVFKIIYPFIFALVPAGLFYVFKTQTDDKIAFLSVFFFMSIFTFFREMLQLGRQEIAELFFVLIIVLLVDKNIDNIKKSIIFIIFAFCLVVSHYGLSYVFIIYLITTYVILYLIDTKIFKNFIHMLKKIDFIVKSPVKTGKKLTSTFILLFIVFAITWYLFVSGSSVAESILHIGNQITSSLTDLFNPESAQGLSALTTETNTFLRTIIKYLNLFFQFLIVLGFMGLIFKMGFGSKKIKISREFMAFSFVSLIILFMGIAVPYFASALNVTRLYHITLFFLAPFSVLGGITFFWILSKVLQNPWKREYKEYSLKFLSILMCVLFLCNTGYVYEITGEKSSSFALGKIDFPVFNDQEVLSAKWLKAENNGSYVYADDYRRQVLKSFNLSIKPISNNYWVYPSSYIFTGRFNNNTGTIMVKESANKLNYHNMSFIIGSKSEIYSNGDSHIYYRG